MLFIGIGENYRVDVRDEKRNYTPQGDLASVDPSLMARFTLGGCPDWAKEEAAAKLPGFLRGVPRDLNPFTRLCWFDSLHAQEENGWSDVERELVEQALLRAKGGDHILVEKPRVAAPWPAYPKLVAGKNRPVAAIAKRIAERVLEDEYDPAMVIAYERENLNRPQVIEALQALDATEVEAGVTEQEELVEA